MGTLPKRLWNASPEMQRRLLKLFRVDAAVVYRGAPAVSGSELLPYYGEPALVSSAKAQTELGFAPAVQRERAMSLTLEWATEARLVRADDRTVDISSGLSQLT